MQPNLTWIIGGHSIIRTRQNANTHLPISKCGPHMTSSKFLLLSYGRIIIFCVDKKNETVRIINSDIANKDILFLQITNARSSGVRNLAVCGKSTRTIAGLSVRLKVSKCRPGKYLPNKASTPTNTVAIPSRICEMGD
jgi:hypothetical protein